MLRERRRHANFKPNRKLDRKSSRGMIYENEELRLRTININAEVERGQSDIKKLRRENYQLRKEIWSLRDEYDRLGKLLKTKNRNVDDAGDDSTDCTNDCKYKSVDRCCNSNEDNISCDICLENEDYTKQCNDRFNENATISETYFQRATKIGSVATSMPKPLRNEKINLNFDDLSIVSEECLSNSEDRSDSRNNETPNDQQDSPDNVVDEFPSTVPPLTHFENLSYHDIGPNLDSLPEIHIGDEGDENGEETTQTSTTKKPDKQYFFSQLKSKRKASTNSTEPKIERPDVFIDNALPSNGNKTATIRKPHKPLKCPNNSDDSCNSKTERQLDSVPYDIPGLSKGITDLRLNKGPFYENGDANESSDSSQMHPYRSEMSLVLSYNGNKSKYSTIKQPDKMDSDVESTSSPKLPHAMKLFPDKLTYGANNDRFVAEQKIQLSNSMAPTHAEFGADDNNSATLSSGIKTIEPNQKPSEYVDEENSEIFVTVPKLKGNDETDSVKIDRNLSNPNQIKHNISINVSDGEKSTEKQEDETKDPNKFGRRVSIHCNGKSITEQNEAMPSHSSDCDANCTDCGMEEPIPLTPTSFRLRRASCNQKFNDDSFGSLLYPPSPFLSYKRGKKSFFSTAFGPRRHSDIGLIPNYHNQYYPEYNISPKTVRHCRSHGNHHHHHHHHNHQIDASGSVNGLNNNTIAESTGTSICNSLGSSRESLASLSQRSTSKRKLSVGSHSQGGKIPWCACWGNGCI